MGVHGAFTIEYITRLLVVKRPLRYATSFLAWSICWPSSTRRAAHSRFGQLAVIRILRLLRAFRVLKLVGFIEEARDLQTALRASRRHHRLLECGVGAGDHLGYADVPR